jgi:hypothetical protein
MYKYEFRFLNGVAEVYDVNTGQVVLHQPFKPMDASHGPIPQPWDNRDEAYAWTQVNFNHHLEDRIPDYDVPPTIEADTATSQEPVENNSTENNTGTL